MLMVTTLLATLLTALSPSPAHASAFTTISAGGRFSCGITPGGAVRCWGENGSGQLGNGGTTQSNLPVQVTGITSGATAVSAGFEHACAIVSGAVKCWGNNVYRQLGAGSTASSSNVPLQATDLLAGATAISSGERHSCAVVSGAALCWGNNSFGQLGDGSVGFASNGPVAVTGLASGVSAVGAGYTSTCGVISGAARCWGDNFYGQLGNSTNTTSSTQVQVSTLSTGVTGVSVGRSHACAVSTTAGAKCWGRNTDGQLGDGTNADKNAPVSVSGLSAAGSVSQASANADFSCAITSGAARCWGDNAFTQLGNAGTADTNAPVQVVGLTSGVTTITSGGFHACAVAGNTPRCWGNNLFGQLGDGSMANTNVPVFVNNGAVAYAGVDLLSTTSVRVRWTDTSQTESGYYVYRVGLGTPAVLVPGCSTTTPNLTECVDTGLIPGTYYTYYVYSVNSDGTSQYPGTYVVTRTPADLPLAPPATYVLATGANSVKVGWNDTSTNESGFRVYRYSGGALLPEVEVAAGVTSATFTDPAMDTNSLQVFVVAAFNASGETTGEYVYSAGRTAPSGAAPTYVGANVSGGTANISWVDNATNETGYVVYRSDGTNQILVPCPTGPNVNACTDSGLSPGQYYRYWVYAVTPGSPGDPGTGLWVHTPQIGVLAAPTITDAAGISPTSVRLHWLDNATDETGYKVFEYVSGTYVERSTLAPGATTATLTGVNPGSLHIYSVAAVRGTDLAYSRFGTWAVTPS
jgi:alpha-tubulin suppressor-like RCC1 family protein